MIQDIEVGLLMLRGFSKKAALKYVDLRHRRHFDDPWALDRLRGLPLRRSVDELFSDILTTKRVLSKWKDFFQLQLALVVPMSVGVSEIRALPDSGRSGRLQTDDVFSMLEEFGGFEIRTVYNDYFADASLVEKERDRILLDGLEVSRGVFDDLIESLPTYSLILQRPHLNEAMIDLFDDDTVAVHLAWMGDDFENLPNPSLARYCSRRKAGGAFSVFEAKTFDAPIDFSDPRIVSLMKLASDVVTMFPEMEYLGISAMLTNDSFNLYRVDTGWESITPLYEKECERWARKRLNCRKSLSLSKKVHIVKQGLLSLVARHKGFKQGFMYRNWLRGVIDDYCTSKTTFWEKLWAHNKGYYSYRIRQYGLTKQNYDSMVSDCEYKKSRPINPDFRKWFWNKAFLVYVLGADNKALPAYWFRIVRIDGCNVALPYPRFSDGCYPACRSCLVRPLGDVLFRLRMQGRLALKPAIGSHGKSFHKLDYSSDFGYKIDGESIDAKGLESFLASLNRDYIVTDYVESHSSLKKIYDGVTGTIRIMTIAGISDEIVKYAYFRLGSSASGGTDNIAHGGIVAQVDVVTGEFGHAEILADHVFHPCPVHPDSGVEIRGRLPHWDRIRMEIEEICRHLSPMEYLGFDVAITEEGYKIIEINSHQDLHKYPLYPQDVKDYLLKKIHNTQ